MSLYSLGGSWLISCQLINPSRTTLCFQTQLHCALDWLHSFHRRSCHLSRAPWCRVIRSGNLTELIVIHIYIRTHVHKPFPGRALPWERKSYIKGRAWMTGSDLRTEKTRAIFPTARILFRMTSLRIAEVPPGTECNVKIQYNTLSI